ncbi:condensation domain-containing protein, partial [Arthrospira platensis SPKY1]|nr:condensation domain-containing protein [Arthrospira platensis SPKY1]
MLAIRTQVNQQQGFGKFLQSISELLSESFAHDAYPYDELIRSLEKSGKAAPQLNALFSMMPKMDGEQAPALDLSFSGAEGPGGISFDVEYSTERFRQETIEKLFARFELILQQVLAAPDMLLEDIDIV